MSESVFRFPPISSLLI